MKMNRILYLLVLALTALTSCEERPDELDNSLKVGNILLDDNTVISPLGYDKDRHSAIGVIFYANVDTVLVVGTKEIGKYIYSDSVGTIPNVINDYTSLCGTENTAAIMSSEFNSPAVEIVKQYQSNVAGWAVPSAGEWKTLANNIAIVRKSMALVGGDDFLQEQYLSSSQDGATAETTENFYYSVCPMNGFVTSVHKNKMTRLRAILRIR